ncbi:hypothetical protein [Roseibacillus persicicus]|nr:hypothetical protein [Roseibacillus persicicus]
MHIPVDRMETGWLIGTWEFTYVAKNVSAPFGDFYHFANDGLHVWECPFKGAGGRRKWPKFEGRFNYRESSSGYWVEWPEASYFFPCWFVGDQMFSTGRDGRDWCLRKLKVKPEFMSYFVGEDGELYPRIGRFRLNRR